MLILYDGTTSVCAIKVRLALAEKGLKFKSRNVDLRKGEQFANGYLKLNPNAVVPTLVDNDEVILESSIIMQYLEDLTPEKPLLPKTPLNRPPNQPQTSPNIIAFDPQELFSVAPQGN